MFPKWKSKGQTHPRVIWLPAEAVRLLKKRMGKGRIFRTKDGRPFNKDLVRQRFEHADGIELICPHRKSRKRPPVQDGRSLKRYRKRWTIERTMAWLQSYRRLVVRYEHDPERFIECSPRTWRSSSGSIRVTSAGLALWTLIARTRSSFTRVSNA